MARRLTAHSGCLSSHTGGRDATCRAHFRRCACSLRRARASPTLRQDAGTQSVQKPPPRPSSVSRCVRAPHVASCSCACARQLRRAEAYMRLGSFDRAAADLAQVATSPPSPRVAPGSALSFKGPAPSANRTVWPAGARSCPEECIRRARARGAGAAYPHRLWRGEAHFRSHVRRVAAPSALVGTALLAAAASGRGE